MFEPFLVSPWKAKLAHFWIGFTFFLTAVSCLVTFEQDLHTIQASAFSSAPLKVQFSGVTLYDKFVNFDWKSPSRTTYARLHINGESFGECDSAGDATLAFAIFPLLITIVVLFPIFIARIAGLNFPTVRDVQQSLNYEIIFMGITTFCFFVQTCAWGVCFSAARKVSGADVIGKGYGLILACFFFQLFITIPLYLWIKWHQEEWMIGIGAVRSGARARNDGIIIDQGDYGDSGQSAFAASDANNEDLTETVFSYKNEESKIGDSEGIIRA